MYLNIMFIGGVSLDNMVLWFEVGVMVVGVGGNLLVYVKIGEFGKVMVLVK